MKLYQYFDQHWGQDLSVSDEEIRGVSGFPESSVTQFLSFLGLIAGGTTIWTHPITLGWVLLALFFLVMSFAYAYGRDTRIDRENGQITFAQSFFGIPVASEEGSLDAIHREEETGWIRKSTIIIATTNDGGSIPLFHGASPSERESLDSHWTTLNEECPELIAGDEE